ncbi:MAG TPA: class D sortase [Thermoanaerobaculia bacterium]|nr:class D sortase [Thermoanaerobaculia bacterium]
MTWLRRFERLLWGAGILLIAVWAGLKIHSAVGSRRDLQRFAEMRLTATPLPSLPQANVFPLGTPAPVLPEETPATPARVLPEGAPPDYSLWSKERIAAYEESRKEKTSDPLAILRIPKIGLEVAVLEGTDDLTLNRAVGHIEDTPKPGGKGNVGIAGHRDGFFRGLKDIVKGDELELETLSGTERYRVSDIWIVQPDDVYVLDPTPEPSITLVACYPFYFVGHAPKRYIVRATRSDTHTASKVP